MTVRIFLLFLILRSVLAPATYFLCINEQLGLSINENVTVEYKPSAIDCIKSLESGNVKFTIATSDEALLATEFITKNTTVMGYFEDSSTEGDVSLTTIVLSKPQQSLCNATGLKYCHPGFGLNIAPAITSELLKVILNNKLGTNNNFSTPKDFFHHLNSTLGPSCIAGPWTADIALDENLKSRFPKLLELCHTYDKNMNPFEQSMKCLIDGVGNIGLIPLQKLDQFNNISSNKNEYFSLCRNNSLKPLTNPCSWSKQLLLLANINYIDDFIKLRAVFSGLSIGTLLLLRLTTNENVSNLSTSLLNYTERIRQNPVRDDEINICVNKYKEIDSGRNWLLLGICFGIMIIAAICATKCLENNNLNTHAI